MGKIDLAHVINSSVLPDKLFHPRHQPIILYLNTFEGGTHKYKRTSIKKTVYLEKESEDGQAIFFVHSARNVAIFVVIMNEVHLVKEIYFYCENTHFISSIFHL